MTTKQEALERLLQRVRRWEQPHEEVKLASHQQVFEELMEVVGLYAEDEGTDDAEAYLVTIAAAAVYLLIDEVTVVEGRSLEEWLKVQEDYRLPGLSGPVTQQMRQPVNDPTPINGAIGGRL